MDRCRAVLPSLVLVAVVAGCGGGDGPGEAIDPSSLLPGEPGPFHTGYRTWDTTYTARTGEARTIPIHVWYPTEDELTEESATPRYLDLFSDLESIVDASVAAPVHPQDKFPVLLFSHGHQGVAGGHYKLMHHFASHGWLGVAVGHVGNQLTDPGGADTDLEHFLERGTDVSAALDALDTLDTSNPLAGRIDTSRVVVTGHSRGAYTAWAVAGSQFDLDAIRGKCADGDFSDPCAESTVSLFQDDLADERVVAILPTAGEGHKELFGGYQGLSDRLPVLYMTAENDSDGQPLFDGVDASVDLIWVELAGGCHEIFNLGLLCEDDQNDYGMPIFQTYAMAFARRHALGDESPAVAAVVDGSDPVRPQARYHRR